MIKIIRWLDRGRSQRSNGKKKKLNQLLFLSPLPSPTQKTEEERRKEEMAVRKNPLVTCQRTIGNILRSPAFGAAMNKVEVLFRLGFRFMITPIFVGVAVTMMSSVAYYWFKLIQPAWGNSTGSLTWCLSTSIGIWLLFNVGWNYFRCMFTPSYHPLPKDHLGNLKRESDCASFTGLCSCSKKDRLQTNYARVSSLKKDNDSSDTVDSDSLSSSYSKSVSDDNKNKVDVDAWNYCKKCDLITPPRAMHCFLCNRCVLGMDHHCPWLATCIGYNNHSYFFLFLFYVVVGCLYLTTWTLPMFYSIIVKKHYRMWSGIQIRRDRFALTMMGILPATFVIAVGAMMVWHGVVLATGSTSLEFTYVVEWVKDIINNFCSRNSDGLQYIKKRRHPFDQGGMIENWKELFGVQGSKFWWILWCMPISHERSGNGINVFVVDHKHKKSIINRRYTTMNV